MAIDMSEVRQLFFEESFENIDIMESGLLDLEVGSTDREHINTIFRAAHSIKGGASIFKFDQIVAFAHIAETLLDEMREGQHVISQEMIDALLRSVDVMRMMLTGLQEDRELDTQQITDCEKTLHSLLNTTLEEVVPIEPTVVSTSDKPAVVSSQEVSFTKKEEATPTAEKPPEETLPCWKIVFEPYVDMLKTGNDPVNLFRELAELGELKITVNTKQLPSFGGFEPQNCYLSWTLTLCGNVTKATIMEIFEWVAEDCELTVTVLSDTPLSESAVPPTTEELSPPEKEIVETTPATPSPVEQASASPLTEKSSFPEQEVIEIPPPIKQESVSPPAKKLLLAEAEVMETATVISPSSHPASVSQKKESSSSPLKSNVGERKSMNSTENTNSGYSEVTSVRVGIDKIDALINMVGELVITQSMLDQIGNTLDVAKAPQLRDGLSQLERNTRELQESVMRIRMLPISYSFNRFPRLVHDLSEQLGKKVDLKLTGEQTELDKTVLEKMNDPLVHLVRNALDHGIEVPAQRVAVGKPERGLVWLHAFHQSGNIVIQIGDDGAGFNRERIRAKAIEQGLILPGDNPSDEQLYDYVFYPGFTTVTQISDLSGRGVGMDVVRRNIHALGGTIDVQSKPNQGTTFNIRLPLTLAILDGQLIRVGQEIYILPLLSILESLRINQKLVSALAGKSAEIYRLRNEYIPILRLYELFDIIPSTTQLDQGLLVVIEGYTQKVGLFVDELLSQQQIVIKSLESNFKQVVGISGATILGDGSVALILDIAGLTQLFYGKPGRQFLRTQNLSNTVS